VCADYPTIHLSAVQMCADLCLTGIASIARNSPYIDNIAVFYDHRYKSMTELRKLYKPEEIRRKWKIADVVETSIESHSPLQGADIMAFETWKRQLKISRRSWEFFIKQSPRYVMYLSDKAQIRHWFAMCLENQQLT